MLYIENNSMDPHFNLAFEEYVLKHLNPGEDIIILWQNSPSVIIGRNQNTIEEINSSFIKENNINVVRRLSGGGAVYHDEGNLNFTFIVDSQSDSVSNFKKFTKPVIDALGSIGINAEFSGRNDITIDGKKFSGNAQYYHSNRLLHHGTILFNSDLSVVQKALMVKGDKIESKGIKSVRSRVTNIYPYLKNPVTIDDFRLMLLKSMLGTENIKDREYKLSDRDFEAIDNLMKKRYMTWEWNYGESPNFDIQKSRRYPGGSIDIRLNVKKGAVSGCKIFGDFFGKKGIEEFENMLIGANYEEGHIRKLLANTDINQYFFGITLEDFIDCLFY